MVHTWHGAAHSVTHTKITSSLSLLQHGLQAALGSSGSGMWRNCTGVSALPRVQVKPCSSGLGARQCGQCFCRQSTRQAGGTERGHGQPPEGQEQDKPLICKSFSNGGTPSVTCVLLEVPAKSGAWRPGFPTLIFLGIVLFLMIN